VTKTLIHRFSEVSDCVVWAKPTFAAKKSKRHLKRTGMATSAFHQWKIEDVVFFVLISFCYISLCL
jgi:hypothetical protein